MSQPELSLDAMTAELTRMGKTARQAAHALAQLAPERKVALLNAMADAVAAAAPAVLEANAADLVAAQGTLSPAMIDRLTLDGKRIDGMVRGLRSVAAQRDPVGREISVTTRPNGLAIHKVSVPIGVIGIIYEARPNVTVDAAGICLKAGNAVILRGGKEAFRSNMRLAQALADGARSFGAPEGLVQLVPWTAREAVGAMLKMDQYIDLMIPRGGEGLIRAVVAGATMPVIKHYKGVCHLYCDGTCDPEQAKKIIINAKCQRPGVCNALETLLVDRAAAPRLVPELFAELRRNGVTVHADAAFRAYAPEADKAEDEDFYREYLALELSAKLVDGAAGAVAHINHYGSHHSDGILSNDPAAVETFLNGVDSAVVYHNASTRFTDGGEFGMGAEIGISTDKLHARGPMGVDELVSYKYIVRGTGQTR